MSATKKLRVVIAGASGETGRSISTQLLASPDQFDVVALARPESAGKEVYKKLGQAGAAVEVVNFQDTAALAARLAGADVVISCLLPLQRVESESLIDAAHQASVGRFVPSFFGPFIPPRGVMRIRELREDLLDRCKRLYLPYTVIDVGYWLQMGLPAVPSGRFAEAVNWPDVFIGNGETPTAMIDQADVGRYVARIITDPRTLNRSVAAYGEVTTQKAIWAAVEAQVGEAFPRQTLSLAELDADLVALRKAVSADPDHWSKVVELAMAEYKYSRGVRGDNTPEHAVYLGYLDAKELYPDLVCKSVNDFVREVAEGTRDSRVYVGQWRY